MTVEYYDWHGHPIEVEVFDATDGEEWDVSAIIPEHPTGAVPAGECHYLCCLLAGNGQAAFWVTAEAFDEHADPLATRAVGFDD